MHSFHTHLANFMKFQARYWEVLLSKHDFRGGSNCKSSAKPYKSGAFTTNIWKGQIAIVWCDGGARRNVTPTLAQKSLYLAMVDLAANSKSHEIKVKTHISKDISTSDLFFATMGHWSDAIGPQMIDEVLKNVRPSSTPVRRGLMPRFITNSTSCTGEEMLWDEWKHLSALWGVPRFFYPHSHWAYTELWSCE